MPYKHAHISYFNCFAHSIRVYSHFLPAPALMSISFCVVNCYIVATSQASLPPQSPGLLAEPEKSLHQWVTPQSNSLSFSFPLFSSRLQTGVRESSGGLKGKFKIMNITKIIKCILKPAVLHFNSKYQLNIYIMQLFLTLTEFDYYFIFHSAF